MIKLSVVISAFNEEKRIEECLKSVKDLADEIIVVDNSSTDKTVVISKKYTKKILLRPNNHMLNINKNFGFSKATGSWILSLDADERVTSELIKEIKEKIGNWKLEIGNSDVVGYWIPRKNMIFGKWIEHTGWYPDFQLRLFKKDFGKFEEEHVHEMIKINGKTEYLQNNLLHYNYSTIYQFLNKLNIYISNEAEQLIKNGYEFKWQDAIRFPMSEFLSRFFARKGYKDGFHGLMLSILMAFYHFLIFAYIWEKKGFREYDRENFLIDTKIEFKKATRDVFYWISKEKLEMIKNPLRKNLQRIANKFRNL